MQRWYIVQRATYEVQHTYAQRAVVRRATGALMDSENGQQSMAGRCYYYCYYEYPLIGMMIDHIG